MVIAIDYDKTITDNTPYPLEGNIRPEALKYIPLLYEAGHTLVLWTARRYPDYKEAVDRLEKVGLKKYFSGIGILKQGYVGKIEADFYIDDRAIPGELNWETIYNYIINKEEKSNENVLC